MEWTPDAVGSAIRAMNLFITREILFETKWNKFSQHLLMCVDLINIRAEHDIGVVHRLQRPQVWAEICTLIILRLWLERLSRQVEHLDLQRARNVNLRMDIFFLKCLFYSNKFTSNMINFAFIARLDDDDDFPSVDWYLDDMYVLKCAVVGKMIPLIKYSDVYSVFFYLLKNELVVLIFVTVMISGSPSNDVLFLRRWLRNRVKV